MSETSTLLKVTNLKVSFDIQGGQIDAVKGVSFSINKGEVVAIVGESGSGKSVIAQSILRILPRNGHITNGEILFDDPATDSPAVDIASLDAKHLISTKFAVVVFLWFFKSL